MNSNVDYIFCQYFQKKVECMKVVDKYRKSRFFSAPKWLRIFTHQPEFIRVRFDSVKCNENLGRSSSIVKVTCSHNQLPLTFCNVHGRTEIYVIYITDSVTHFLIIINN